jgi:hypothetical protein
MLPGDKRAKILDALKAAEEELATIREELERLGSLQAEAARLERFIREGQALCGEELPADQPAKEKVEIFSAPVDQRRADDHMNLGDRGKLILAARGQPMHVRVLTAEFFKRGWHVSPQKPNDIVRSGLRRDPDIERVGKGVYALKHWPDAVKYDQKQWIMEEEGVEKAPR